VRGKDNIPSAKSIRTEHRAGQIDNFWINIERRIETGANPFTAGLFRHAREEAVVGFGDAARCD
jgi:hypothetical protein